MANQHSRTGWRKRTGLCLSSALLLASLGCGMQHGKYQGDPMLGNFNRPIAPTPPIWTGGDPGFTPAYDGGAHIGLPSPDVPARSNSLLERMFIVPTYSGSLGIGGAFGGAGAGGAGNERVVPSGPPQPTGGPPQSSNRRKNSSGFIGARLLPGGDEAAKQTVASAPVPTNNQSVTPRSLGASNLLTSGSALEPISLPVKPISPIELMKDPKTIASVEEGQTVLTTCGAKSQRLEQEPTGEWRFICTLGQGEELRRYEAKSTAQIEAVRAVLIQIKKEQ